MSTPAARAATAAALGALASCLFTPPLASRQAAEPLSTNPVALDLVVVDRHGRTVQGLHAQDFRATEDGHSVRIVGVREVSAAGITGSSDARSVVLLLDNTDIRSQIVARQFATRMRPGDKLFVVRMTHPGDELTGDLAEAMRRIDESQRFAVVQGRSVLQDYLDTVARIARDLQSLQPGRHTVLVCISASVVCNVYIRPPKRQDLLWPHWTKALGAAAAAHLSVYYVDPAGTTALVAPDLGDGLVEHTGGDTFYNSNNFTLAVDRAWDEAGHYYLLDYVPAANAPAREIHSINVRTMRRGLHVRVRHSRGDGD